MSGESSGDEDIVPCYCYTSIEGGIEDNSVQFKETSLAGYLSQ